MADYKKMYYFLMGQVAGSIESLQAVVDALKKAQQTTEEMYISSEDEDTGEAGSGIVTE
ncbi:MAG: hypothetical protein LBR76_05420 [Oscillospiraceae bacterium]|jgi:hypothetical protein|nr:hypothetical protein [Oscillospiraceae bacterium]